MGFCLKKPIKYRIGKSSIPGAFVNEKFMRSVSHSLNQSTDSNVSKVQTLWSETDVPYSHDGHIPKAPSFAILIPLYISVHLCAWDIVFSRKGYLLDLTELIDIKM